MRYRIGEIEIKSENAAKPAAQPARHLVEWIRKMPSVDCALDYGCGKLRYAGYLTARSKHLTLVDSEVQIGRKQQLGGEQTTVRSFATAAWPNTRVLSIEQFEQDTRSYDFALCANVLSAIPKEEIRSKLLTNILAALSSKGSCLFVTQFYNSEFRKVAKSNRAVPHLDGWIVPSLRGHAYYGMLGKEKVMELLTTHGYAILKAWTAGQSAYVLAGRTDGPTLMSAA